MKVHLPKETISFVMLIIFIYISFDVKQHNTINKLFLANEVEVKEICHFGILIED